ncbi:signal peptidase II [Ktedonosporobacter rubrisoli]|uniref:signal peptidase II n=1 Tax=Ktedonosporobacter rubrisoli TaxID=2509675 RepID=UPI0013EEA24B|nr:signal peptidase II [Ktedonosporobacter rubrisoli]
MIAKRARIYDALALLTVIIVVGFDQWTKALVVENFSPAESKPFVPLIGHYLGILYIQNRGAAFGMLANSEGNILLAALMIVAIGVVLYLYFRMLNSGTLAYKLIFGLIIGGALGNLIDRAHNGGYVVDFLSFRIPEINYYFAIFNIADACISVGVFLLFVFVLFGGFRHGEDNRKEREASPHPLSSSGQKSGALRTTEQDVQS